MNDAAEELARAAAQRIEAFLSDLPPAERLGLQEWLRAMALHPGRVAEINRRYYRDHLTLWTEAAQAPAAEGAAAADRRFAAPEWASLPFFRLVKQAYLLNSRWLKELAHAVELPEPAARRLEFALRQYLDALAPTNFPATNPEVLKLAAQTGGASLAAGLRNLRYDTARGRISMSDELAFRVGGNLASTSGGVVYENPVAQLIEYTPRTPSVHARPLLIVPPFINKYYILDLQPHNSFVRFALDQGLRVFMVSWRNPGNELRQATWEDYAQRGVLEPLAAALEIAATRRLNALGFCVGGTLLTSTMAVMPQPERVASLTLLASLLDFTEVGEIGVYIDEAFVAHCEREYAGGGLMPGARLAGAFASLRANDLVWRYHVDNYLKGKAPEPFDLLFWNADSANLPGPLYAWYLRNAYLENKLCKPRALNLLGRPLDLGRVKVPTYLLAAREDHIVPWTSAFAATRLLGGRIEFTLAASGHVAGAVSPPGAMRRCYWRGPLEPEAARWLAGAQRETGSWWLHWSEWVRAHAGKRVRASQQLGSVAHPVIEAAPGRYVVEQPE